MSMFSCSCWLPKAAFVGSFPSPPLKCACSPPSALPGKLPHSEGAGCAYTSGSLLPRAQNPGPICLSGQSTQETHGNSSFGMANPSPLPVLLASEDGITTTTPAHELELGVIRPAAQSSSTPPSHPHMQLVINSVDVIFRKAPWHTLLLPPWATSKGRT